jgi:hypothetical protein
MKTIEKLTMRHVKAIQEALVNIPDVQRCIDILGFDRHNIMWYTTLKPADVPKKYREVVKALKEVIENEGEAKLAWCSTYAKKHKITPIELVQAFCPQLLYIDPVEQGEQITIKLMDERK